MLPEFLIPETTVREAGSGADIRLGESQGGVLILTLGITRIIEQQSLEVSIWASADGNDCGTYQVRVDLSDHPEARYLRAKWQVHRWGRGDPKPLFTLYLFAEVTQSAVLAIGA